MAKIIWTLRSMNDIKSIYDFISLDSQTYAKRFIQKLVLRVEQLNAFPDSGRIVPEKEDPSIRELIEGNYRIFYRIHRGNIYIIRIYNSARRIK